MKTKKSTTKIVPVQTSQVRQMGKSVWQLSQFVNDVRLGKTPLIVGKEYVVCSRDWFDKMKLIINEPPKEVVGKTQKASSFLDMFGQIICEGDICVGKTDYMHPTLPDDLRVHHLKERDVVRKQGEDWKWNGNLLQNVAKNIKIIGNIYNNPELIL